MQEALTNVARHARARRVRVALARDGATVQCTIRDEGFDLSAVHARHRGRRLGLIGMGERRDAVGGMLRVDSSPGGGRC